VLDAERVSPCIKAVTTQPRETIRRQPLAFLTTFGGHNRPGRHPLS
jgi:hypothetical protein